MHREEEGSGCSEAPTAALNLAVGAAGPSAAARPLESGRSCAATGKVDPWGLLVWTHLGYYSTDLKVRLGRATGAHGVEVLCDLIPNSETGSERYLMRVSP